MDQIYLKRSHYSGVGGGVLVLVCGYCSRAVVAVLSCCMFQESWEAASSQSRATTPDTSVASTEDVGQKKKRSRSITSEDTLKKRLLLIFNFINDYQAWLEWYTGVCVCVPFLYWLIKIQLVNGDAFNFVCNCSNPYVSFFRWFLVLPWTFIKAAVSENGSHFCLFK